jgi:transcriptional regulator with XRE-family HTH domain
MGHSRPRPKHLAKKVLQIRRSLGISQGEMVKRLGVQELIDHTTISKYELDKNEPPLAILLAYARVVEIPVEQIIDDELELTNLISARAQRSFPTPINVPNTSRHGRVPC